MCTAFLCLFFAVVCKKVVKKVKVLKVVDILVIMVAKKNELFRAIVKRIIFGLRMKNLLHERLEMNKRIIKRLERIERIRSQRKAKIRKSLNKNRNLDLLDISSHHSC